MSENSNVSFPLKTLVTVLGATAIAVSGYLSVTNRLASLEVRATTDEEQIQKNEEWINNFEPPPAVKSARTPAQDQLTFKISTGARSPEPKATDVPCWRLRMSGKLTYGPDGTLEARRSAI